MREIKFRAWDKRHGVFIWTIDEVYDFCWECSSEDCHSPLMFKGCEDLILQQYTGLKDKNGIEIYEGDILSYPNSTVLHQVVWYKDGWWRRAFDELASPLREWADKEEVIGNIYENPELIKERE